MFPTRKPFWKRIEDIPRGPRTCSPEQHQKLVKKGEFDLYFRQQNRANIKRWLEAVDSEVCVIKESTRFYIVR